MEDGYIVGEYKVNSRPFITERLTVTAKQPPEYYRDNGPPEANPFALHEKDSGIRRAALYIALMDECDVVISYDGKLSDVYRVESKFFNGAIRRKWSKVDENGVCFETVYTSTGWGARRQNHWGYKCEEFTITEEKRYVLELWRWEPPTIPWWIDDLGDRISDFAVGVTLIAISISVIVLVIASMFIFDFGGQVLAFVIGALLLRGSGTLGWKMVSSAIATPKSRWLKKNGYAHAANL